MTETYPWAWYSDPDVLAAELGVSKIPLREALARLEHEGLLRLEANRGFFVRTPSWM